jgi:membrane-anchored protein YejM (alkaline phosphatase superfamily)
MQQGGQLNNTIVIVLGDHGNRFTGLRKTDIGRIEDRMPFLAVSLPKQFKHRFPHLVAGLEENRNNLLSWYVRWVTTTAIRSYGS